MAYIAGKAGVYLDASTGSNTQSTWLDQTANGNNATLNDFNFNSSSGWTGTTLKTDGNNDNGRVTVPGVLSNAFTFHTKIKIGEIGRDQFLMHGNTASNGNSRNVVFTSDNKITFWSRNVNADGMLIKSMGTYNVGDVVEIAAVHDGTVIKLYCNGIFQSSIDMLSNKPDYQNTYYLFYWYVGANFFNGETYYISIYNTALTEAEIQQLHSGAEPTSNDLSSNIGATSSIYAELTVITGLSLIGSITTSSGINAGLSIIRLLSGLIECSSDASGVLSIAATLIFYKDNGVWKPVTGYAKINGTWQLIKEMYQI